MAVSFEALDAVPGFSVPVSGRTGSVSARGGNIARHPVDVGVGQRLRYYRVLKGMTQRDVAVAVGVTMQQFQKYEAATNRISASKLVDVAAILDVCPGKILTGRDDEAGLPSTSVLRAKKIIRLGLFQEGVLESRWREFLHDYSEELVSRLPALNDGRAAFSCAKMLSFPLPPNDAPSIWYSIFEQFRGDFDRSTQTTQLVYVFVLCIHHGLERNRRIAAQVMPELRARVISGGLSTDDELMLDRWLPHHTESWDINRRMLKLVRQAYKRGSGLDDLVTGLGLSDSEYAYATNQDPDNFVRQVFRVFMPWGQW